MIANRVSFTLGAEVANARTVAVQLKTINQLNLNEPAAVKMYLSTDAAGLAPVNPAVNGVVPTDSGAGALVDTTITTTQAGWQSVSSAAGLINLTLTNAADANVTTYLNVILPNGKVVTSSAIAFLDDTP